MRILLYEIVERAFCFVKMEIRYIPNLSKLAVGTSLSKGIFADRRGRRKPLFGWVG